MKKTNLKLKIFIFFHRNISHNMLHNNNNNNNNTINEILYVFLLEPDTNRTAIINDYKETHKNLTNEKARN
ncbi:hypothetical protein BCR32DRAFT_278129 [Anaeromyces robustus]|uniref:Uncharacterized protein n=1 Tax=Anaeromyces robustus TaxID=1754192 RepID=A0A1Y1XC95_9FUNG|nr:hypothetical protein BCR32DRAFT_278129 [Anaeromyces robustus]|eukprot:ORX83343.1 hypothetical protein BCR32DRAFT_278129 [Anaeromyces robustus]